MPRLRNMDESVGQPQRPPAPGMCKPAQVRYPRKRRENWPFKFYEESGRMYQNVVPRRRKDNLDDVEEAPW
jgi:hypothetical protein